MKTFKIILICIFSATLAFVAFRSSLRGTKAIYETTQPWSENTSLIHIHSNLSPGFIPTTQRWVDIEHREIMEKIQAKNPLFCEVLPLTLEEIFISETEVAGYEVKNLFQ